MKHIDELWRERFQAYMKELRRYLKYMFNDHLLFVLIFGGGAAIYYYSGWVKTLTSGFPVGIVMAFILGIVLTISPISTFLKEADLVFLLPLETKLGSYFRKGINLSFISQAYIILLILAACMPMYVQVTGNGFSMFFFMLFLAFGLKIWNLMVHWQMLKIRDSYIHVYDWIIRYIFNFLLFYFFIEKASFWFFGVVLLIMAVFTIYVREAAKNKTIKWEILIEKEQGRMQAFYHAANMFTDVPHLRGKVKRRRWLDPVYSIIPYGSEHTYRFLFSRTLIRTSEFSGLIIRLTLITILIILFSGNLYLSVVISVLFLYLTGFQLFPLIRKHELKIWTSLYPVEQSQKRHAFLRLLLKVLLAQAVLFGICALISTGFRNGIIVFVISVLFTFVFAKIYAPGRVSKLEKYY
ncbi:ABC transporter permease [Lederbergia wuyishanensis]|uniref:ABC-2 type transport system permease protein n=1 Tax=Lederbergia wuyishanensis TaxID=1347903 RepID=A0ABU0CYP5_9BACI|nr:ABC transporter permease [Lederbergia wuyishanensis]MCJ8005910.1 ABC transporter permease [Lederbergia wuyishanensis]MDQ0341275.1 ABC-2 type transport system permease protein [Lederbergia wuyishanensis]